MTLKERIKRSKKLNKTEKAFLMSLYKRGPDYLEQFTVYGIRHDAESLLSLFAWWIMPEGVSFWRDAHEALEQVLRSEGL